MPPSRFHADVHGGRLGYRTRILNYGHGCGQRVCTGARKSARVPVELAEVTGKPSERPSFGESNGQSVVRLFGKLLCDFWSNYGGAF